MAQGESMKCILYLEDNIWSILPRLMYQSRRESFTQAMISSPRDRRVISNFSVLLQDEDYIGDPSLNAHEEYLQAIKK